MADKNKIFNLFYLLLILLICHLKTGACQLSFSNTPPVMYLDRNWIISETENVNSIIARVKAQDNENDKLTYGLEPLNYGFGDETRSNKSLPFRIDEYYGIVYLNESLVGRGGENFFLYVTVSDGQLTAKSEVYVNIKKVNGITKLTDDQQFYPPTFTPNANNLTKLLPAFHLLPGVTGIQNYRPSVIGNTNQQQIDVTSADDGDESQTSRVPSNNINENNINRFQPNTYVITNRTGNISNNNNNNNNNNINKKINQNTTKLIAINTNSNKNNLSNNFNNNNNSQVILNTQKPNTEENQLEIWSSSWGKTIFPIIVTICVVIVIIAIILLFLFRKRLCLIGKTLKKKSKEEMAKKSSQNNSSSNNILDDSRNSMVLQQWNGPTAFTNRYVPWDLDNQHVQATSQLSTSSSTANSQIKSDGWEFPRHRLKFFNILGEGAFGQVWRCEAIDIDGNEGATTVAVKTLKENATEVERNDLHSELQVMKSLETHVNVVRLLGSCTEKEPIFVILEFVNKGKLQTYLRNSRAERHYGNTHGKSNILTSGDLTSFMYQVGRGMDFLTSRGIIHRDLAARNVLITDDHTCKVADFGFARDVITSKIYERKSEGKLPIRWMAIESLYDNIFSVKSDIWSFGILMWEIVTLGSTPYPGISAADVMRKVRDGYRLEKPEHCRRELYNIMYYCWAKDPNERPSFAELVQLLDKLLSTEMDYIELERFPDHNYYNMLSLSGEKL